MERIYKGVKVTKAEQDALFSMYQAGGSNLQVHVRESGRCALAYYATRQRVGFIPKRVKDSLVAKGLLVHNPGKFLAGQDWYWLA
jgi:hypothetical protein